VTATLRAPRVTAAIVLSAVVGLTACGAGDDDASPAGTSDETSARTSEGTDGSGAATAEAADPSEAVSVQPSAAGEGDSGDGAGSGEVVPGGELAERVRAAVAAAGSARSSLTSTVEATTIASEGVVDFSQPYRLDVTTTIGSEGGELVSRVVAVSDSEIYVQVPDAEQWFRIDAADDGGLLGELGTEYYSPEGTWSVWGASGDFEVVGQETVEGVDATHYRLTTDEGEAALPDGLTSVDVWIGADDLPVRTEVGVTEPISTVSIVYSDWGVPVDIQPPPADQVLDEF
jgi:hypothetical protein